MYLTREQARDLDRRAMEEFGVPGVVLMENAGRGMAELLRTLGVQGPVVICCGKGNNGGDGLVIARHLDNAGVNVRVLLFTTALSVACGIAFGLAPALGTIRAVRSAATGFGRVATATVSRRRLRNGFCDERGRPRP